MAPTTPAGALDAWRTIIGHHINLGEEVTYRDLWPVTAEDGSLYFLKRYGPWRNLPLADEARVLRHLANQGISVAEFRITDHATLYAGFADKPFVLMPRLPSDDLGANEILPIEETVGAALAQLHLALASYPWSANSYTETSPESLSRELMLPPDIAEGFSLQRDRMVAALSDLPVQLLHGDLTPENVLLKRPGVVSGFIDFDHLPLGPRVWDIGKYLSRRTRLGWRTSNGYGESRLAHLPRFLAGYHRTNPLTQAEIDALPSAIAAGNVLETSYFMEISAGTLPRRKLPDHDVVLEDTTEAARWHLQNWDEVTATVRTSLFSGLNTF